MRQLPIAYEPSALVDFTPTLNDIGLRVDIHTPNDHGYWSHTVRLLLANPPTDSELRELGRAVWIAAQR